MKTFFAVLVACAALMAQAPDDHAYIPFLDAPDSVFYKVTNYTQPLIESTIYASDSTTIVTRWNEGDKSVVFYRVSRVIEKSEGLSDADALRIVAERTDDYFKMKFEQDEKDRQESKAKEVYWSNRLALLTKSETVRADSDQNHEAALTSAILAWRQALGVFALGIRRPKLLIAGDGGCTENGIACVAGGDIAIDARHLSGVDLRTILMHEIGHLLGVPHIEGDALMNPSYQRETKAPSAFAVAIAKSARRIK